MERVKNGERYWYIHHNHLLVLSDNDYRNTIDDNRYEIGNYFHTKEEAEEMACKLRAVLNGAEVIEPMLDEDKFATEATFDGEYKIFPPTNHLIGTIVTTDRGKIVEFIKSKL